MNLFYLAVASYAGTLALALLAWTESQEKFNLRKFLTSAIRGLVVAAGVVAFSTVDALGVKDLFMAFIGGAGGNALIKSGMRTGGRYLK